MDFQKRISLIIALVGCALSACDKGDVFDDRTHNNPQVADMSTGQEGGTNVQIVPLVPEPVDATSCLGGTVTNCTPDKPCIDISRPAESCKTATATAECTVLFKQIDLSNAKVARLVLYASYNLSGSSNENDDFLANKAPIFRETRGYVEQLRAMGSTAQLVTTFVGTRTERHRIVTDLPLRTADAQVRLRLRAWCAANASDGATAAWKVDGAQIELEPQGL